jgi:AraC family transcriptional activator of pobA
MKAGILNEFSLQTTDFSSLENLPDLAFVNEHIAMLLDIGTYRNNFVKEGTPYRLVEGRILWVTRGSADFELTLDEYHIKKGDIVLLAPENILELKSCSDDYSMIGVMYKENMPIDKNLIIHPEESDWHETMRLANILWDIVRRTPFRHETVSHIVSAIISDIQDINRAEQELAPKKRKTRQELVFSKFKKLVNEHCSRHRTIPFYANELALTPHYLSSLIAKISGQSVMYWINRATLIQAKVLLKNKDILISEVADRLNFPSQSAFGYFFKRETGMTPSEYQKMD